MSATAIRLPVPKTLARIPCHSPATKLLLLTRSEVERENGNGEWMGKWVNGKDSALWLLCFVISAAAGLAARRCGCACVRALCLPELPAAARLSLIRRSVPASAFG